MDRSPGSRQQTLRWSKDSFDHYHKLVHSVHARDAGASVVSGFYFNKTEDKDKDPLHRDLVYDWRECTKREYELFPGVKDAYCGVKFTTVMVEGRYYLPYLTKQFLANGGKIEKRTVRSFEEFAGSCDLLMNCTGLRSRELLNDTQITPIRGQMIRVRAPWVKHFV